MKNNSLAMLALIALVAAPASLIGYIDPKTCPVEAQGTFVSCQQAAEEHITAFWVFAAIGILTFAGSFINRRFLSKRRNR